MLSENWGEGKSYMQDGFKFNDELDELIWIFVLYKYKWFFTIASKNDKWQPGKSCVGINVHHT